MKNIKYSKNLEWLHLFVGSVKDLVPVEKLTEIRGYRVPITKAELQWASITTDEKKYRINLRTTMNYYIEQKQRNIWLSTLLESFAHEMAHLKEWEHTVEHFVLTSKIMLRFGFVLKHMKVKDLFQRVNFKQLTEKSLKK